MSSRQRFEDWCKESGHWYLTEDRQAFSVWSARDAEVDALKDRLENCHRYACVPGNCNLDGENCAAQPEYKR